MTYWTRKYDELYPLRFLGYVKGAKMWNVIEIGKWAGKGKTLPQILVADPDWFFWAVENDVCKGRQASTLAKRARSIKLPPGIAETHIVQHWLTPDHKYARFDLIDKTQVEHHGSSTEIRRDTLNLEFPRKIAHYDKTGCKLMMSSFKTYWFAGKSFTKERVEEFFDNPDNFLNP
jgi:hypothetical protein